jgi:hypothetical protein
LHPQGPHWATFVLPAFCKADHIWQQMNEWANGRP